MDTPRQRKENLPPPVTTRRKDTPFRQPLSLPGETKAKPPQPRAPRHAATCPATETTKPRGLRVESGFKRPSCCQIPSVDGRDLEPQGSQGYASRRFPPGASPPKGFVPGALFSEALLLSDPVRRRTGSGEESPWMKRTASGRRASPWEVAAWPWEECP